MDAGEGLAAVSAELDRMPWRVYEVRRAIRPRASEPAKAANASRSLRAIAEGDRAQIFAILRELAGSEGAAIEDDGGIERAWLHRRGAAFPAAEHILVAAPAGPGDKEGPGFVAAWEAATAPGRDRAEPSGQLVLPLTWATGA